MTRELYARLGAIENILSAAAGARAAVAQEYAADSAAKGAPEEGAREGD